MNAPVVPAVLFSEAMASFTYYKVSGNCVVVTTLLAPHLKRLHG